MPHAEAAVDRDDRSRDVSTIGRCEERDDTGDLVGFGQRAFFPFDHERPGEDRLAIGVGDLVELERSEIKRAPDGRRAIILRPNKRRRRVAQ